MLVFGKERVHFIPHCRIDNSRRNRIHIDLLSDQFQSGGLGNADHRGFACSIDGGQCFPAACLGRHVDNFATASLLDHLCCDGLESEKETLNIDGEYLFVSLRGDFEERTQVKEACTIDQNIDAAGNVDGVPQDDVKLGRNGVFTL